MIYYIIQKFAALLKLAIENNQEIKALFTIITCLDCPTCSHIQFLFLHLSKSNKIKHVMTKI